MTTGEVSLEQLLMQEMQDTPTKETTETTETTPLKETKEDTTEEIDVNDALSQSLQEEDNDSPNEDNEEEEEKEKEKNKDSEAPDSSKNTKNEDDESQVPFPLAFARYQLEQGNFTEVDEEELLKVIENDGDAAALSYLQNKELEKARSELLDTYEEDVKYYLDLLDSGVDAESAKNISKAKGYYEKLNETELEDDEKETLRKDVLTQYYKLTTKFSDAKIKKEVENKVALGEDIEAAKEALPEIKEYFKQAGEEEKKRIEQQRLDAEKEASQRLEEFNKQIEAIQEIVPGVKVNKPTKDRWKNMITKPVKEVNGVKLNSVWAKRSDNPNEFDIKLAALIDYGVFDGKWDKIIKSSKSKATEEIENAIKGGAANFKSGFTRTKTSSSKTDGTSASIDSLKNAFGGFIK